MNFFWNPASFIGLPMCLPSGTQQYVSMNFIIRVLRFVMSMHWRSNQIVTILNLGARLVLCFCAFARLTRPALCRLGVNMKHTTQSNRTTRKRFQKAVLRIHNRRSASIYNHVAFGVYLHLQPLNISLAPGQVRGLFQVGVVPTVGCSRAHNRTPEWQVAVTQMDMLRRAGIQRGKLLYLRGYRIRSITFCHVNEHRLVY